MGALGTCANGERCRLAKQGEPIEIYPGFGECCPECGKKLVPLRAASEAPRAAVPASEPPETFDRGDDDISPTTPTLAAPPRIRRSSELSPVALAAGLLFAAAAGVAAYFFNGGR